MSIHSRRAGATHPAPKKSLGQHFLADESYLTQVADAADLTPNDIVLEIGPGMGTLTRHLAARAGRVIAVELDDRLIAPLREQFAQQANVTIVHGDILKLDVPTFVATQKAATHEDKSPTSQLSTHGSPLGAQLPYKVVANLPYYITSAVLRHLLENPAPPTLLVVMVQREVAERICAEPGDLSLLAVSVQYYATPSLVSHVPAAAFFPKPKVDSAILRLDVRPNVAQRTTPPKEFFRVVRAGFSQKRKQLVNTLSGGLRRPKAEIAAALTAAGIDPKRRAETVSIAEWERLCAVLREE